MKTIKHIHLLSFVSFSLLFCVNQNLLADEYQLDTHFCFGNSKQVMIEGRIIEKRSEPGSVSASDGILKNTWFKLKQFFNDEEEGEPVYASISNGLYKTHTDDDGYFRFDLKLKRPLNSGYQSVKLNLKKNKLQTACQLLVVPNNLSTGIISDFDDTVIISDVTDKVKLLTNTFTKNYAQREVVEGVAAFYQKQLRQNAQAELAPLIFITGSPRQIQKDIQKFLNLHHFPSNIIITKKLNGDNRDPLLDQFSYKTNKIEEIFRLFPQVKFLLAGDDGEKDPEVYQYLQQKFPNRVSEVWIRQVSTDVNRKKYSGQKYFRQF